MDLPDPDGPMMAAYWPVGKPTVTPARAWTAVSPSPYTRRSSEVLTIGRDVGSVMPTASLSALPAYVRMTSVAGYG